MTVNVYRVQKVIKFDERNYAILYTVNGVPSIMHRYDKNHEEHAFNGFVRNLKDMQPLAVVVDDRNHYAAMQDKTVRVTIEVDGRTVSTMEV